ncbi:GNAT family N-acetyltransferase [Pseudomonas sp. CFSAN084952]|uniref:GNAT family N-acetyltransferase n=1 Tax=Pseudomonas TaxID=286 RepID=UPI0021158E48|nr:GNAT family N-acetyltransferase [Pseudomonas sp. CFSAN084952]
MPVAPNQNSPITLVPAQQSDLDNLVAIRIEAMRESLERVGRFDPVRARERFLGGFEARDTRYIEASGERVGFVVVKHHSNELLLDHLYVRPSAQGSGVGSAVLSQIFKEADVNWSSNLGHRLRFTPPTFPSRPATGSRCSCEAC